MTKMGSHIIICNNYCLKYLQIYLHLLSIESQPINDLISIHLKHYHVIVRFKSIYIYITFTIDSREGEGGKADISVALQSFNNEEYFYLST